MADADTLDATGAVVIVPGGGGPQPITRVNSASIASASGTTSCTVTIPAGTGIQANDLIIVCAGSQTGHTTNGISAKDNVNNTNYTTILETQLGGASTRWMQTFMYVTPVAIADGSVITVTGYATAANTECSVDIFRNATASISRAAVSSSNASSTSSASPALASAAPAGDLVLTFEMAGSGTLTPGSPFTKGSSGTAGASTAIGYVLNATGALTYASTWTLGTANTSAAQTVSLAAVTVAGTTYGVSGTADTDTLDANGTLGQVMAIAGSSATGSSGNGNISLTAKVAGSSASVSSASGTIYANVVISSSASAISAATGTLGMTAIASGTSAATSAANGTIGQISIVYGSSATSWSASGAVGLPPITGSSTTVSTATVP
jgi:hypothetical protein